MNLIVMWAIGGLLIYLAIAKEMEPKLLPMGFGAILVNLPNSGAAAVIEHLFEIGIAGHERCCSACNFPVLQKNPGS